MSTGGKQNRLKILYEDDAIIAVGKPAGLAVQTKNFAEEDLESLLRKYMAGKNASSLNRNKMGAGRDFSPAPIHRLDQPVQGVVLFAKTKEAAAELNRQMANRQMEKIYEAVIYGSFAEVLTHQIEFPEKEESKQPKKSPEKEESKQPKDIPEKEESKQPKEFSPVKGVLKDVLYRDGRTNTSRVVTPEEKEFQEGKEAVLYYEETAPGVLRIRLESGRHHQIRVQLAHAGHPILGDLKYATKESMEETRKRGIHRLQLTASELTFIHPVTKKKMTVKYED